MDPGSEAHHAEGALRCIRENKPRPSRALHIIGKRAAGQADYLIAGVLCGGLCTLVACSNE